METVEGHPIQVVVRRTGLSPHVIRMWEKRYAAVQPQRTATNRRRYSDADIQHLLLLCRATRAGRSIGQIAHLSTEQLLELVTTDEGVAVTPPPPQETTANRATPQTYFETCMTAVGHLDAIELETALARARIALSQPLLLEHVIAPMMDEIGWRWRDGSLRIMHEHLASAVVRSFLGNLAQNSHCGPTAPSLIVTTPEGYLHEIGALIAACTAAAEGWDVTYLGAQLPIEEIAAAVHVKSAKAVALSLAYPEDDPHLEHHLSQLRRYLPEDIALIVGGRATHAYKPLLDRLNIAVPEDLAHLRHYLETLRTSQA